jgi:regulator of sigma E protease
MTIVTVVSFIIILAILVLIHEFGHYIVARWMGIKVEEFGFGFPPRVWGKKIGETLYSINLLPIGGFVKVYGEEYHEDDAIPQKDKDRAFVYKKPWQKAAVIVAGVIMNFLLGWILISFLFTRGVPTPTDNVYVEQVQKGSPAAAAGLREGDQLVAFVKDGQREEMDSVEEFVSSAKAYGGQIVGLELNRNGKAVTVDITPRANPPEGQGSLGIVITTFMEKKYPWYEAPWYGLKHAFTITKTIVVELGKTLGQLITFQKPKVDVTGPVGIAQYTGQAIQFGSNAVLELIALLSLNLAVINLLPFPALDGGRLVFIIYEWVTRKRVNANFERYLNLFGIITLLGLSVVITVFDIMKLFK